MSCCRIGVLLIAVPWAVLVVLGSRSTAAEPDGFATRVRPFLKTYCSGCHGAAKQEGDLRVDALPAAAKNRAEAETWQLVLDNLQLGEMPPSDAKQPPAAEVDVVTAWIQAELRRAAAVLGGEKNEVVLRRLNRYEYENTIEDLFDVRGDYAVGFPEDAKAGGFNTNGAALTLSAEQLAQYLRAADFVLNRAIALGSKPQMRSVRFTLADIESQKNRKTAERDKRKDPDYKPTPSELERRKREEAAGRTGAPYYPVYGEDRLIPIKYLKPNTSGFFPVREAGWYRFEVVAYAVRNEGQALRLQVAHGSGRNEEVPAIAGVIQLRDARPQTISHRVYLQPGHRVELEMLDGTNWLPGSKIAEDRSPAIAIRAMQLEGPLIDQWPPRGHQLLLGNLEPGQLADADVPRLLRRLAPQLFRRPVDDAVIQDYVAFYRERRQEVPPLEAYKLTVKGMLSSPQFLFHVEPVRGSSAEQATQIDDYALANRLSYFLWRSAPDEELFSLAADGKLAQPANLRQQAARLLADPKSDRFLKDFVDQWLQVSKVGEMQPDKGLYPEYDEELERAMVLETRLFIRELLVHDLSLGNVIDSDWTMLNDRLARHYGIDGVEGNQFRKVRLDKSKTVRGGLLTQASFLSITSNGTTTSPVVRGVWVLERLLGTPAPLPPPDVPPIEPDIRGASTIQEQLQKHRTIAQCNSCHRKIDGYGLALENFDVIGGWRERYRALIPQRGRPRPQLGDGKLVIPADEIPKLGAFQNFREFRALLSQHEPLVFHNVAEKLAAYSLGRRMGFTDREHLETLVQSTRNSGGGLRTMVLSLIESPLFRGH